MNKTNYHNKRIYYHTVWYKESTDFSKAFMDVLSERFQIIRYEVRLPKLIYA